MKKSHFFGLLVFLSVALSTLHYAGSFFQFYLDFWWFDIMMHALGGAIAGGFTLIVFRWIRPLAPKLHTPYGTYLFAILGALFVGLFWEIFEKYYDLVFTDNYALDTTIDIVMDMVGAAIVARHSLKVGFIETPTYV